MLDNLQGTNCHMAKKNLRHEKQHRHRSTGFQSPFLLPYHVKRGKSKVYISQGGSWPDWALARDKREHREAHITLVMYSLPVLWAARLQFHPSDLKRRQSDFHYLASNTRQVFMQLWKREFSVGSRLWNTTADCAERTKGKKHNATICGPPGQGFYSERKPAFVRTAARLHQPWDGPLDR